MKRQGNIHIDVINVGFGQAVAAYPADEKAPLVVVDGGDDREARYNTPPYTRTLVQHLDEMGLGRVDLLVASHPHRDHVGGLDALAESREIVRFASCYPPPAGLPALDDAQRAQNMPGALWRYALLWQKLRRMGTEILECDCAEALTCGPFTLELDCPEPGLLEAAREQYRRSCATGAPECMEALNRMLNAASLVVRLEAGGFRLLVPSDVPLSRWGEHAPESMAADVMIAPHHGDSAHLSAGLIGAVGCGAVVVSAATDGLYQLPSEDIGEVLQKLGVERVLFTAGDRCAPTAGGVRFVVAPGGGWSAQPIPPCG